MNETKKGLRIISGILLLILACFSVLSVASLLIAMKGHMETIRMSLLQTAIIALLGILTAVFILARKFTVTAVIRCLLLGFSAVTTVLPLISKMKGASFDSLLSNLSTDFLSGTVWLVGTVAAILLIVGLFLHNRKAKPLLIVAAVLSTAASIGQAGTIVLHTIGSSGSADALNVSALSVSVALTIVPALLGMLAWILLGVYFGAQQQDA